MAFRRGDVRELVIPAVALLYWVDTHGELEGLTDADLRRGGAGDQG
ncbi:hypothetical protein ABT288_28945 [Streptomyces sp. NPDC001093]